MAGKKKGKNASSAKSEKSKAEQPNTGLIPESVEQRDIEYYEMRDKDMQEKISKL